MRGPVAMLNTEQQICGPSLVSNIEKNRSKKDSKDVNELSQHFYSSEIIIVSRISLFFSSGHTSGKFMLLTAVNCLTCVFWVLIVRKEIIKKSNFIHLRFLRHYQ